MGHTLCGKSGLRVHGLKPDLSVRKIHSVPCQPEDLGFPHARVIGCGQETRVIGKTVETIDSEIDANEAKID